MKMVNRMQEAVQSIESLYGKVRMVRKEELTPTEIEILKTIRKKKDELLMDLQGAGKIDRIRLYNRCTSFSHRWILDDLAREIRNARRAATPHSLHH